MIHTRSARRRMAMAMFAVLAVVSLFVWRLVDIQVVRADELDAAAALKQVRTAETWGVRGSITDTDGVVLADSVERYDITASPKDVEMAGFDRIDDDGTRVTVSVLDAIGEVAEVTGSKPEELYAALTKDPTSNFTYLVKAVKLDVFQQVRELGIPWVFDEPHPSRTYPNGQIAGNLVGFIGTDGPLAGTERKWDGCLAGTDGSTSYEVSRDYVRIPGSTVVTKEARNGGDVRLTIDSDLQWYAQQMLAEQGTAIGADWATAFVVEVKTGRIRAAADWPSVDPNSPAATPSDFRGSRIFTAPYEPGSIMKPATFASLLDAGKITLGDKFTTPGRFTDGLPTGSYIKDAWAHDDIRWTAAGILMNSSNVGISQMSQRLGVQQRHDYLAGFGFGTPTSVGFLGEESGLLVPVDQLDSISNLTQQFGQAISATSAQMGGLYQTLGNHGVRIPLSLVEGCEQADGTVTDVPSTEGTRVVSTEAADQTVLAMETVASEGTLHNWIGVPGYRVAAKTGTAEVPENGRYGSERIVSVAGLVPVEDPQYAVIVTFGKPDTMKTSAAAAPTFGAIVKQVIKTFRVTPSTSTAPGIPLTW